MNMNIVKYLFLQPLTTIFIIMVVGGDEMIEKSKRTKAIKHASSKKTKDSKNQKRRKKGKGSRIRSRSKTKKTSPSSGATSVEAGGEKKSDDEQYRAKANECDGSCMVKPEKLTQTCTSLWSEPTTCCIDKPIVTGPPCENVICKNVCLKLAREEVYSEAEKQHAQAKLCIDRLSNERNYFKAEFERLLRILQEIGESKDEKEANNLYCLACQKNDKMIEYLQKENEVLAKEKFCLMSRLEEGVSRFDVEATSGKCCKTSCKRTERERDLLRLDIQRLEEETDCLREKIKVLSENKTRDYARFQEQRTEYENVINRLEGEKRELMKGQGIRRLNINTLEEKVDMYTNSLKVAQEETQRVKTQYSQLKKLHDQCDKALLDTQAQLMEVEMQLLNYQNKKDPSRRNSKDIQVSLPKYSCTDVDTQANITTPKDIQMIIQQLNTDKDNLLAQLDNKTELLFQCQENAKNKDERISELEKEIINLDEKLRSMENIVIELKEKCNNSSSIVQEKETEIMNLQSDNEQILVDVKNYQNILEEKEAQKKILQAELEQLYRETHALATSNHLLQNEAQQYNVQMSVALETVNELENKTKQLEDLIPQYESKIRLMKNDTEDYQTSIKRKEMEIDNLLKNKSNLQTHNEQLDMENRAHEKTILDLKCECERLSNDLNKLHSKEKMIADLHSTMHELKGERDSLGQENLKLNKKVNKLENKLFQCICTICDNAQEKCSMATCLLKDFKDRPTQYETTMSKTKGIQSSGGSSTEQNSIKQVMAAVPLRDEQSSKVITSMSTLPGSYNDSSLCKKDAIISSMYRSVEPSIPFRYKQFNEVVTSKNKNKSNLNIIAEERCFFNDGVNNIHDLEQSSWSVRISPEVEEKQKYIIDNVTSVCKVIQVDTEERIFRKRRLGDTAEISK